MVIHSSWFKRLNLSSKKNLKNILLKSQKNLISTISFGKLKKDLNKKNESIFNPISPLAQRQYILEATSPTKVFVSSTTKRQWRITFHVNDDERRFVTISQANAQTFN